MDCHLKEGHCYKKLEQPRIAPLCVGADLSLVCAVGAGPLTQLKSVSSFSLCLKGPGQAFPSWSPPGSRNHAVPSFFS